MCSYKLNHWNLILMFNYEFKTCPTVLNKPKLMFAVMLYYYSTYKNLIEPSLYRHSNLVTMC